MKKKLWLTYAWVDNEDKSVDLLIAKLAQAGLEVGFDRACLLVGQSIWQRIAEEITRKNYDAWAIFVTAASLQRAACREELDYALLEALNNQGEKFPLIGIFAESVEHDFIPKPLQSRIYVKVGEPNWVERVVSGVSGTVQRVGMPPPLPAFCEFNLDTRIVEFGPRLEGWLETFLYWPVAEFRLPSRNEATDDLPFPIEVGPKGTHQAQVLRNLSRETLSEKGLNGFKIGMQVPRGFSVKAELPAGITSLTFGGLYSNGERVTLEAPLIEQQ